jgi:hypothetical protein
MSIENAEHEARFRQALERLSQQFLNHPDVSLIDIGLNIEDGRPTNEVVLRIHVRRTGAGDHWPFPRQIDGIPVIVMYGDYKPESTRDDG